MIARQDRIRELLCETVKEAVTSKYSIADVEKAIVGAKLVYPHEATSTGEARLKTAQYFTPLTPIRPLSIKNDCVYGIDKDGDQWKFYLDDIASIDEKIDEGSINVPVDKAVKMNPDSLAKMAKSTDVTITEEDLDESTHNIVAPENVKPGMPVYNADILVGKAIVIDKAKNMNRLRQYDSTKIFPKSIYTISDFYDKFGPEDYFIAVDMDGEKIVGFYGPQDFYVVDFPGERAPKDTEVSHEPSGANNLSIQTNEEDLEEKKKKRKKDTAGLHGVGWYQITIGPTGDVDRGDASGGIGGDGGGSIEEATNTSLGEAHVSRQADLTKESIDSRFEAYKTSVLDWLATLDSGDKLINATKHGRSDAFIKSNMAKKFSAQHTADAIRAHWYGV